MIVSLFSAVSNVKHMDIIAETVLMSQFVDSVLEVMLLTHVLQRIVKMALNAFIVSKLVRVMLIITREILSVVCIRSSKAG